MPKSLRLESLTYFERRVAIMAEATLTAVPIEGEEEPQEETLSERFMDWVRTELVWYAGSFTIHLLALSVLLLFGPIMTRTNQGDAPVFESKAPDEVDKKEPDRFDKIDIGRIDHNQDPPPDLDLALEKPRQEAQEAENNDESKIFEHRGAGAIDGEKDFIGGGVGGIAFGSGPKATGVQSIGMGQGNGGTGFGTRGIGSRKKQVAIEGGTPHSERAVAAALVWLANHQMPDGSWSLEHFDQRCISGDKSCTGRGSQFADSGATAMGLLPFLAAGQTHKTKGLYKEHITKGILWLLRNQQPDGCLANPNGNQAMYSHGLATIALSEAYGLSGDHNVGTGGASGCRLHSQIAKQDRWRLAISSRHGGRHFGCRLAVDGPEERPHGRIEFQPGRVWRHEQVARFRGAPRRHAVLLSARPRSHRPDDGRGVALPPISWRKTRESHAHRRRELPDAVLA